MKNFKLILIIILFIVPFTEVNGKALVNGVTEIAQIDSFTVQPEVKIFPNPVKNKKFKVTATKFINHVELYNIMGQKTEVLLRKINEFEIEVSFREAKNGIYLVTIVFSDNTKEVRRIVVN